MKRCSTLLTVKRNANQNHNEVLTSHLSEWLSSKNLQVINIGEGLGKKGTVGGKVNWYSYYGK